MKDDAAPTHPLEEENARLRAQLARAEAAERATRRPVTDALVMAAKAARLLGAQVMLTGIKPHVAEMLVRMGADITGVETLGSLQADVAAALRRR